jgi:hypothetical protein
MGELIEQSFYEVGYQVSEPLKIRFGKIIVPFGDTRRFHHFYGGIQGYGGQGVMLPNVWAENGLDLEWDLGHWLVDTYWVSGWPLLLYGADFFTEYGLGNWALTRHLRFAAGRAVAEVHRGMQGGFEKAGDYFELATNVLQVGEIRTRYGTYIHDDRQESQSDVHNFNVGYAMPIDVLRLLVEYQWNYEAVEEIDNDVFRVMVSLDF